MSILAINPTYNIGPSFVSTSTYQHLPFLTQYNVHSLMLGPPFTLRLSIFFASKGDSLPGTCLKDVKVFGSYSKTNVYKLFVDLFPSATHLLCDLHMKDNFQSKLSYLNFNITTKDEVMCDSESIEEFDHMVVEIQKKKKKKNG